jgi:serine/threonine protein kinase
MDSLFGLSAPSAASVDPMAFSPQEAPAAGWFARLFGFVRGRSPPAPAPVVPTPLQPIPAPAAPVAPAPGGVDDPISELFYMDRTMIAGPPGRLKIEPVPPIPTAARDTTVIVQAQRGTPGAGPRALALTVLRSDVLSFVGQVHVLAPGATVIGRAADADLRLQDPLLTRQHARLELSERGLHAFDLGSSNGSFINGVLMAPGQAYPLHLGAQMQVGSTVLSVSLPGLRAIPDLSGQTVAGIYTLRACLQSSPKGVVYRAEKTKTGVMVAMKILSPDYASYPGYSERFAAEARIAARLQHPHICSLDDFGEADIALAGEHHRLPYSTHMIMSGGSLADRVAEFGTLPLETIARWMEHAADALQHAHGKGVVHGNLKPSTLCFDGDGNLYVTDFSVAAAEPTANALFGTPAFMAPEQWAGGAAVPATDQYALAAVAYYVLTGSKPYDGQEDPEKRARNLAEPPPAAHLAAQKRYQRKLSSAVTAVLNKGLAVAPDERYATVAEFAQGLAGALKSGRSHQARQIFISYRRDDSAILATFIADQLEKNHGVTSFVDTQGMDGATRFPARIERAIQDCEVFVCILGAGTLQSGYVRKEIATAFDLGKPMIPVFQEDYTPPPDDTLDAAVNDLLQFDGIPLLDKRNVYVFAAVAELAQQIRLTLDRGSRH